MSTHKAGRDITRPLWKAAIDLVWNQRWELSDFMTYFENNWDELARVVEEGKEKNRQEWEEAIRKQRAWEQELRESIRVVTVSNLGLPTGEARQARIAELKVTLQRTHPDKGHGDPIAFNAAKRELDRLRAGRR